MQFEKDPPRFTKIFCLNNYTQLQAILSEYKKVAHRSIQETFQREMSGDLLSGMLILGRLIHLHTNNTHRGGGGAKVGVTLLQVSKSSAESLGSVSPIAVIKSWCHPSSWTSFYTSILNFY